MDNTKITIAIILFIILVSYQYTLNLIYIELREIKYILKTKEKDKRED